MKAHRFAFAKSLKFFACQNNNCRVPRFLELVSHPNGSNGNGHLRIPEEWTDHHHPVDDIEPVIRPHDQIRDARQQAVRILNSAFAHIESALSRRNATVRDVAVAFWQPAYGLGLNICKGKNMTECAERLNVKRATISKGATSFCLANDLQPSFEMKKESARKHYQVARIDSIKSHQCQTNR